MYVRIYVRYLYLHMLSDVHFRFAGHMSMSCWIIRHSNIMFLVFCRPGDFSHGVRDQSRRLNVCCDDKSQMHLWYASEPRREASMVQQGCQVRVSTMRLTYLALSWWHEVFDYLAERSAKTTLLQSGAFPKCSHVAGKSGWCLPEPSDLPIWRWQRWRIWCRPWIGLIGIFRDELRCAHVFLLMAWYWLENICAHVYACMKEYSVKYPCCSM